MTDWLNDTFDNLKTISDISYDIDSLANAFNRVGNQEVSDELWGQAEKLRTVKKNIRRAVGESVNESYKASQEATGNMILACLAMDNAEVRVGTKVLKTVSKKEANK